jgi:dihydroxy-acid dehydratase
MKKKYSGIDKGLTNYGDKEFSKFLRRSFAKSMGYSNKSLNKPIVGICYTESGFNNCHRNFPEILESLKNGVLSNGALPIVFPMISLGETFLNPTSMMYRNLMSMCVEEMIAAQPMDSVILLGGCDKNIPALLMGSFSTNVPSVLMVPGPMMTGSYNNQRVGACTDCRKFWAQFRSNEISKKEIMEIENKLATTSGTCPVMGTASTMAILSEVLGIMPINSATAPAIHADRLRIAERTGEIAATKILQKKIIAKNYINRNSFENALRVLFAISGSTNALIHLTAMARRLNIKIDLKKINKISDETPVLVNLKPVGTGYMEDFHNAGGLDSVLKELKNSLNLECKNLEGISLKDRIKKLNNKQTNRSYIFSREKPINKKGGLIILFGSLAPDGAILKRAAATTKLLEHEGKAIVFSSLKDLSKRIDNPNLKVSEKNILILKNAGPSSDAGMPEAGYLPIPKKLAKRGVKDMIRISDARMSGTAFGTIVLHVTPEGTKRGPLAVVKTGDKIKLSEINKRIDLMISKTEIEKRLKKLKIKDNKVPRGYKKLYLESVLPATQGCDFDFL